MATQRFRVEHPAPLTVPVQIVVARGKLGHGFDADRQDARTHPPVFAGTSRGSGRTSANLHAIDGGRGSTRCEEAVIGLMWRLVTALDKLVCRVHRQPGPMFRTEANHVFDLSDTQHEAYTLAPNDRLQLQLFSNRGQRLMADCRLAADNQGANPFQQQQRAMSPTAWSSTAR